MRIALPVVLALAVACAPAAGSGRIPSERVASPTPSTLRPNPVTTLDVVRMTEAGLDEQAILDRIAADGVSARLTPEAARELRGQGVSPRIIGALHIAPVVPRHVEAPPPTADAVQPWWFADPGWSGDDYGRTLQVR